MLCNVQFPTECIKCTFLFYPTPLEYMWDEIELAQQLCHHMSNMIRKLLALLPSVVSADCGSLLSPYDFSATLLFGAIGHPLSLTQMHNSCSALQACSQVGSFTRTPFAHSLMVRSTPLITCPKHLLPGSFSNQGLHHRCSEKPRLRRTSWASREMLQTSHSFFN